MCTERELRMQNSAGPISTCIKIVSLDLFVTDSIRFV